MNNFYKTNSEILKLDPYNKNDLEYLQFNQYLCRKENFQRFEGDFEKGLFRLSYTTIIKDTGLTRSKVQKLMKWFENKGVIQCIEKSKAKGKASLYAYTSIHSKSDTNFDTNINTDINTDFSSDFNSFKGKDNTNYNTDNDTNFDTSKKENIKREYKKNIYSRVIEKLNTTTNSNYKTSTTKTRSLIDARLNEGFTVEDFEKVIDIKAKEWLGTDMEKFLRPATLFSNKFESYLNQKESTLVQSVYKNNYRNNSICKNHRNIPIENEICGFADLKGVNYE